MRALSYLNQLFIISLLAAGCASGPKIPKLSKEEVAKRDQLVGLELSKKFESRFKFSRDPDVIRYLEQVVSRLSSQLPDMAKAKISIYLIRSPQGVWKSYSLPGHRLYLSVDILRSLQFENEAASEIAIQLAHLQQRHVLNRIKDGRPTHPEFFGAKGLFRFEEEQEISALKAGVDILYHGGYDPRGLVSLLEKYKGYSAHSPYKKSTLDRYQKVIRRKIALNAPLLNPIVWTKDFLTIQKKIGNL